VQAVFTKNGCSRLLRGGVRRVHEAKPFSLLIGGISKQCKIKRTKKQTNAKCETTNQKKFTVQLAANKAFKNAVHGTARTINRSLCSQLIAV